LTIRNGDGTENKRKGACASGAKITGMNDPSLDYLKIHQFGKGRKNAAEFARELGEVVSKV